MARFKSSTLCKCIRFRIPLRHKDASEWKDGLVTEGMGPFCSWGVTAWLFHSAASCGRRSPPGEAAADGGTNCIVVPAGEVRIVERVKIQYSYVSTWIFVILIDVVTCVLNNFNSFCGKNQLETQMHSRFTWLLQSSAVPPGSSMEHLTAKCFGFTAHNSTLFWFTLTALKSVVFNSSGQLFPANTARKPS